MFILWWFGGGGSKNFGKTYNLNLPCSQKHNFHLFYDQAIYNTKFKYIYNYASGVSVLIPFLLAATLMLLCIFFVNFLWGDLLYEEIIGSHACTAKSHVYGYRNFVFYLILAIWILFLWFDNIKFENSQGYHTRKVNTDFKLAFILFCQ